MVLQATKIVPFPVQQEVLVPYHVEILIHEVATDSDNSMGIDDELGSDELGSEGGIEDPPNPRPHHRFYFGP